MFQPSFPRKAGTQGVPDGFFRDSWMPAFASMTDIAVDMFPIERSLP